MQILTLVLINAEKIHDGTVSNTEFGHLNGVTSGIQSQIDGISFDSSGLQAQINTKLTELLGTFKNGMVQDLLTV